jgi:hypothetical protein
MRFMVRSRGRDLNGWGVSVTVDIQDISLGNNSGAAFRNNRSVGVVRPPRTLPWASPGQP